MFFKFLNELILILGDRYEIFSAAISAHFNRIPIAHISGGEITVGSFDDAIRHSITKLSSLHLLQITFTLTVSNSLEKRVKFFVLAALVKIFQQLDF